MPLQIFDTDGDNPLCSGYAAHLPFQWPTPRLFQSHTASGYCLFWAQRPYEYATWQVTGARTFVIVHQVQLYTLSKVCIFVSWRVPQKRCQTWTMRIVISRPGTRPFLYLTIPTKSHKDVLRLQIASATNNQSRTEHEGLPQSCVFLFLLIQCISLGKATKRQRKERPWKKRPSRFHQADAESLCLALSCQEMGREHNAKYMQTYCSILQCVWKWTKRMKRKMEWGFGRVHGPKPKRAKAIWAAHRFMSHSCQWALHGMSKRKQRDGAAQRIVSLQSPVAKNGCQISTAHPGKRSLRLSLCHDVVLHGVSWCFEVYHVSGLVSLNESTSLTMLGWSKSSIIAPDIWWFINASFLIFPILPLYKNVAAHCLTRCFAATKAMDAGRREQTKRLVWIR